MRVLVLKCGCLTDTFLMDLLCLSSEDTHSDPHSTEIKIIVL